MKAHYIFVMPKGIYSPRRKFEREQSLGKKLVKPLLGADLHIFCLCSHGMKHTRPQADPGCVWVVLETYSLLVAQPTTKWRTGSGSDND